MLAPYFSRSTSLPTFLTRHRDLGALVLNRGIRHRVEIRRRLAARLDPANLERALRGHAGIAARSRAQGQRALGGVVAQRNARELTSLVAVTHAVILVIVEAAIGAGEHEQRDRRTRLLEGVLHVRAHRDDGPGTHVEWHAGERRGCLHGLPAGGL